MVSCNCYCSDLYIKGGHTKLRLLIVFKNIVNRCSRVRLHLIWWWKRSIYLSPYELITRKCIYHNHTELYVYIVDFATEVVGHKIIFNWNFIKCGPPEWLFTTPKLLGRIRIFKTVIWGRNVWSWSTSRFPRSFLVISSPLDA